MTAELVITLCGMLVGHFIADTWLQPGRLSDGKRHADPWVRWPCLILHGTCHGFFVLLLTDLWWLGLAEVVSHALIDRGKGKGWLTLAQDQVLHILCKVAWIGMLWAVA